MKWCVSRTQEARLMVRMSPMEHGMIDSVSGNGTMSSVVRFGSITRQQTMSLHRLIVSSVKYGNINLDQQFVDFIDTFTIGQCVGDSFVSNYPRFNTFHRKSRQLSVSGISIDRAKRQYFTS
eukprot:794617_1